MVFRHADERYVAVNAAVKREVRHLRIYVVVRRVVRDYREQVFFECFGQAHTKSRISAVVRGDLFAVPIDLGGRVHAVKLNIALCAFGQVRSGKGLDKTALPAEIVVAAVLPVRTVPGVRQVECLEVRKHHVGRVIRILFEQPALIDKLCITHKSFSLHGFRSVSVCRGKRLLLLEVDVIDEFHRDRHDRKPCDEQQDVQCLEPCGGFVGLHGGGFHIADRAQRQRHNGGADALREIAEEGIDRVKRPFLAHALFAVAHFNAVGNDRPHDDLEHAAADIDKHQPGDIQHHAFCVGRDGQEQHQNTRKHTAQAPEDDEPLFADLADNRRGERHERQQRHIGGDHGERRFFRIMEIKLEYQVVDRSRGIVKRHNSEGRDSDGEQRAVREKGLDRGKIADLFYAFLANDTFRHHFAKQDKHKKGHHGKYDSHEEHPAFRKHIVHIHNLRKQHDENSGNTRTDAAEGGKRGALLRVLGDDGVQGTVWNIDHGVSGRIQPIDQKAPDRFAGLRELLHGQKQKDRKSQKPHRADGDPRHELTFFTEPVPIYHAADNNVVDRIPNFRYHNDPGPILGRKPDALCVKQEHI